MKFRKMEFDEWERVVDAMHGGSSNEECRRWIETLREHLTPCGDTIRWLGWGAFHEERMVAATYLVRYPGKLGVLTGPWLQDRDSLPHEICHPIVTNLLSDAGDQGIEAVQSVLEESLAWRGNYLLRGGMEKLANLLHLHCWISPLRIPFDNSEPTELEWVPYREEDSSLWILLIESTYERTLDCPELNGIRSTDDTWEGYLASARGNHSEWWMAKLDGIPIGCILLTPQHPPLWEMTYMGVHPNFRGQQWGKALIDWGLKRALQQKGEMVWLSADERNLPALNLYRAAGFEIGNRVTVWFWSPKGKPVRTLGATSAWED